MIAQPVTIAYEEVYSALQAKTIDAAESMVFNYSGIKFYEVVPYYNLANHQECSYLFLASKSILDKSSTDLREAMIAAGYEATAMVYKVEGIQAK